jgi:hypothetical protein
MASSIYPLAKAEVLLAGDSAWQQRQCPLIGWQNLDEISNATAIIHSQAGLAIDGVARPLLVCRSEWHGE